MCKSHQQAKYQLLLQHLISTAWNLSVVLLVGILLSACSGSSDDSEEAKVSPATTITTSPSDAGFSPEDFVLTPTDSSFIVTEETVFDGLLRSDLPGIEAGLLPTTLIDSNITYLLLSEPRNGEVNLDPLTGVFSYTPVLDFFGLDRFEYAVTVSGDQSETATVQLNVINVNDPPSVSVDFDSVAEQDRPFEVMIEGRDVDGDILSFASANLPGWLDLDTQTGLITGVPTQNDIGIYRNIELIVRDDSGLQANAGPFAVEVLDINDSPTVNADQFPAFLDASERVIVNLFPDDPDGDFVTLQAEPNDFASVEILGGSLALTADEVTEVTDINLVVIATDLLGSSTREIIPITIRPLTASGRGRTLEGRREGFGVHLVVLGDGYKSDEENTFNDDVQDLITLMRRDPAIRTHMSAWNIHSIMETSVDSGIDDDFSLDVRNTAFDSGYFCQGLQRLICTNTAKVFDVALDEYPNLDQIVLLINDNRFGGSGGSIAIASADAPEIAIHEMGHSIAGLADEYVDSLVPENIVGGFFEGRFANVSRISNPAQTPWSHWVDQAVPVPNLPGDPRVGLFEGAFYQAEDFYRPTFNSRMRDNLALFGPVNGEQWVLSVYSLSRPVVDLFPLQREVTSTGGKSQTFMVKPIFGSPIQQVSWFVDGEEVEFARGLDRLTLLERPGEYLVEVFVEDVSGSIRLPSPNASEFRWSWNLEVQ